MRHQFATSINRVTIKVGSSLLLKEDHGPELTFIEELVRDISVLSERGMEIVLVSSGAIGMGRRELGTRKNFDAIPSKQALASVGQTHLMNLYCQFFQQYHISVGQVLLSAADLSSRSSYLNARNTLLTLLRLKIIPVVNENDTVAVEEIKFGDNDTLSALVAGLVDADLLVILSDIKGVYSEDPRRNPKAKLIRKVSYISEEMEEAAQSTSVEGRIGGMQTKIKAAKIATRSGIPVIVGGKDRDFLPQLFAGKEVGTLFLPQQNRLTSRKRWIAYGHFLKGKIVVDKGAKRALLQERRSLLPSGVIEVKRKFEVGDSVSLLDEDNREFARGITYYSSQELEKIKGIKSHLIKSRLGYKYYDEVIHRDNLVIL